MATIPASASAALLPSLFVRTPLTMMTGCVTAMQVLMSITSYNREANTSPAPYSKFSQGGQLSGRQGMLIIYLPALLVTCLLAYSKNLSLFDTNFLSSILSPALPIPRPAVLANLLVVHFGKRTLETLFLHSYSKGVEAGTAIAIGVYYSILCVIIVTFNSFIDFTSATAVYSPIIYLVGMSLFTVGELGNWYHHFLLARLRSKKAGTVYSLPQGGLFPFVTMPHYFFELLAWLGIALVSQQLNTFLVFTSMASYLAGRSVATSAWYKKNLEKCPSKKHLVPFLF